MPGKIGGISMLIIDLIDEQGEPVLRYKSNLLPRVCETISLVSPISGSWEVLKVDHLLSRQFNEGSLFLQLATLTVREIL